MEFNTLKNRLYFGGITSGLESPSNIPASGVYDNSFNSGTNDFFAASMDTNQTFVASTYIGGSANEVNLMGLNTDLNNDVYLFGYTNSTNFPTTLGALQSTNLGNNDKVFLKLSSNLSSLLSSTYYGGAADDYDPVGERGIKFSNCRIYTIVTARSNNIPLTQGALTTTKLSSTSIYEPGLVIWANPPDLATNTLTGNQQICAGANPGDILGSVPSYILPTISRNGVTSSYPSLGLAITYQWQISTDSINWTNISGATTQNLAGSLVGPLFQKTFFRRIIGGDACVIEGSTDQIIVVTILEVAGTVNNVSCFNANNGSISITPSNGTAPYTFSWSNGATTQNISNLAPGTYTVTFSDALGCSKTASFNVTQPSALQASSGAGSISCNGGTTSVTVSATGGTAPYSGTGTFTVSAGNYSYTVTDANGCTSSTSGTVLQPATLAASSIVGSFSCNGSTASVTVSATGGTAPYSGTGTFTVSQGNYSYTVTDANGCTSTTTGSVSQPTTLVASSSAGSISCNGGTTSVIVSATGGTAPYSGTGTFTVSQGNYSYTVTDANGCTSTTTGTVSEPTTLVASSSAGSISCNGGTTSVTVSATGGTAPYSGTGTFTVSAGNYSYTVTDANGCTSTTTGTITDQDLVPPTAVCQNITVELNQNGTVVILAADVDGGSSDNCAIDTLIVSQTSFDCSTVGDNNVVLTVTDVNGNSSTCTAVVTVVDNVAPVAVCQNITVELNQNGTVVILAADVDGGSSDNCAIDTLIVSPSSFNCENVGENNVELTVTDVNGNSSTCTAVVTVEDNIAPVAVCQNITVELNQNGTVVILAADVDGGSSDNCAIDTLIVSQTSFDCSNVGDNNVVLTVTDVNGNSSTCDAVVTVEDNIAPNAVCQNITVELDENGTVTITASQINNGSSDNCGIDTISISQTNFGCAEIGDNTVTLSVTDINGNISTCTATVTVTGVLADVGINSDGPTEFCDGEQVVLTATAGASYLWSPNGETTQSITVTTPGSYSVTVTSQSGCSGSSSAIDVIVNSNPIPTITASGSLTFCDGGSVTLTSSPAVSYLWSPNGETTQSITVTNSGEYTVTVNDQFGCRGTSATSSVTVYENPVPTISVSGPTTFCAGENVELTSSSPTGNVWSPNGETTQTITVEGAGSYSVTVTDNNGCSGTSDAVDVTLYQNPGTTVTASGATNFCEGGSVTLTSESASGYIWSPNGETTQSITVSTSGSYSVNLTNEFGCSAQSDETIVTVYPKPLPVITPDGPTEFCYGDNVMLTSTSAVSYLWSPTSETDQSINVTTTGNYSVTVIDANGCSGTSEPIYVEVGEELVAPVIALNGPANFCEGQSVMFTASSTSNVTYQWYSNGVAIPNGVGASYTAWVTGSYYVVATDANGCTVQSLPVQVNVDQAPNANAGLDELLCLGSNLTLTASGGENYLWSNGETTQSITVSPSDTTEYSVIVSNTYCNEVDSDTVNVNVVNIPVAEIQASDNPSLGNPVNFTDVSGDNSITNWFWDFGDGISATTQNTHHTYDTEGFFDVILTVENQYGCTASDTVEVEIQQIILIPNVITPNGDGFNDGLGIKNNGVDNYEMIIYDRWGLIIFEDKSGNIFWDGKTIAGAEAPAGTYFYILNVTNHASLGDFEQTGFITLIR